MFHFDWLQDWSSQSYDYGGHDWAGGNMNTIGWSCVACPQKLPSSPRHKPSNNHSSKGTAQTGSLGNGESLHTMLGKSRAWAKESW